MEVIPGSESQVIDFPGVITEDGGQAPNYTMLDISANDENADG